MHEIQWSRLPLTRSLPVAREWLVHEVDSGLSPTTIAAYSRAVERYLAHCRQRRFNPGKATTAHITAYLDELGSVGLRGSTLLQHLTAIRLFYAFVVERGERPDNPAVGVAVPTSRLRVGDPQELEGRGPWVPTEDEWLRVLAATRAERQRTRVMMALAYDAALRREELCGLRVADIDSDHQTVTVSGSVARARLVPLSPTVVDGLTSYLRQRARPVVRGEALFLSESPRNRAQPITIWTWSKVVQTIAHRSRVERLTTHTLRHLRLADLARAGWGAGDIARFAGQSSGWARQYVQFATAHVVPGGRDLPTRRQEQLVGVLSGRGP